ncbi:WD40-repeat-containing domain protein [Fennellomyces sp. T-0311]|nr:WD40-repeat-containing domain protein [Fennellomyces sp. T-0311]
MTRKPGRWKELVDTAALTHCVSLEFAYQLLLTISTSNARGTVNRLLPLLHRDFLSLLPYELALHILEFVDALTLARISGVSRRWRQLSQDQSLWKKLFLTQGWGYDRQAMEAYINNTAPIKGLTQQVDDLRLAPVPLARTTASMYDPAALPTMPGAPPSGRLRPFRRPGDLFLRLRQRRALHQNHHDQSASASSSTTTNASIDAPTEQHTPEEAPEEDEPQPTASSSTSALSRKLNSHALPPIPFPLPLSLAAPTSSSRSHPLLSQQPPRSPTYDRIRSSVSTTPSRPSSSSSALTNVVTERSYKNRPMPRRQIKHDETALYHYNETTDTRFINWRRLFRNRHLIDKRWREGKCKMRVFPHKDSQSDMHLEGIYCIQFDEDKIVSGSRDRTIKIWDMRTGECRRTLSAHSASVLCLQYDDRYIISGSSDKTMVQWDIETGKTIRVLNGHSSSVLNLRFSADRIVSSSKDHTIRVWDLNTGETLRVLRGHHAAVNAIQFKDSRIVSASGDRTVKMWDMETGECLRTFDSHSRGIACVEFDGRHIVSGSSDQTIKVWDAETGRCLHTLAGHTDLVRTLQMDAGVDRIISGSYDGSLRIWSLGQGCHMRSLSQAIEGKVLNLQFDYARIVCCSNLAKIVKYDFAHGIDTQFLM